VSQSITTRVSCVSPRAPAPRKPPAVKQHFGPQTHEAGRAHLDRILRVHESVAARGYRPHDYPDGCVSGYFLSDGERHRFVVVYGNHRLAAFHVHGIRRIVARLHSGYPPVVAADELARWCVGQGGLFTAEVAQRLHRKMLLETGVQKAHRLGLHAAL
jgi:hypothetical protein